jgi:hypothetical protein
MKPEWYYRIAVNRWYSESGSRFLTRFILEDISKGDLETLVGFLKKWAASLACAALWLSVCFARAVARPPLPWRRREGGQCAVLPVAWRAIAAGQLKTGGAGRVGCD